MRKSMLKIVSVGIIVIVVLVTAFAVNEYERKKVYQAIKVLNVPDGFIALKSLPENYPEISYGFFEAVIFFQKRAETDEEKKLTHTDKVTIAQFLMTDKGFIVKYRNEYYINKAELDKIYEEVIKK